MAMAPACRPADRSFGHLLIVATLVGGSVAFIVVLASLPLAYALGRALRRQTSLWAHIGAFAILGAVVGEITVLVIAAVWGGAPMLAHPVHPLAVGMSTVAVLCGWWRVSRDAQRALRPPDPRSPLGLERAFSDDTTP